MIVLQVGTFRTQLAIVLLGIPEVDEQGNCYKLDKKHLTIELEGTAEPLSISIEPPVLIIPGKCLLDVPVYRTVQVSFKNGHEFFVLCENRILYVQCNYSIINVIFYLT